MGDASVPFDFDVHAMIFSDDAPKLEAALHQAFADRKLNFVNTRREFFRVTLDEIKQVVKDNFDKSVEFTDIAPAEQYRESLMLKKQATAGCRPVLKACHHHKQKIPPTCWNRRTGKQPAPLKRGHRTARNTVIIPLLGRALSNHTQGSFFCMGKRTNTAVGWEKLGQKKLEALTDQDLQHVLDLACAAGLSKKTLQKPLC